LKCLPKPEIPGKSFGVLVGAINGFYVRIVPDKGWTRGTVWRPRSRGEPWPKEYPVPVKKGQEKAHGNATAKGVSASEAYVQAGFKKNDGNAGRLNRNEQVQSRIEELVAKAAEKAGVTERIVAELAKIGFSSSDDK